MAYQARHRDPLFDSDTQAIIERRGKELLGLTLLGLAVVFAMILGSYSPDDPNWLNATDQPARNLMGPLGAAIASPLYVIAGYGAWGLVAVFGVWGLRFLFHVGEEGALGRLIFAPIGVALVSVYASTHVPAADWAHSFGLGGLFGDTILGALLGVLPVSAAFGLKALALALFAGGVAMSLFVLGFTRAELSAAGRYLLGGVILAYDTALRAFGWGAREGWAQARAVASRRRDARVQARQEPMPEVDGGEVSPAVLRATRAYRERKADQPQGGLLGRISAMVQKNHDDDADDLALIEDDQPRDRISARIADAVQSRVRRPEGLRAEPPLQAGVTATVAATAEPRVTMLGADGALSDYSAFDRGLTMPEPELVAEPHQPTGFRSSRIETPEPKAVVQHGTKKPAPSRRARAEAQPSLFDEGSDFELPPLSLLSDPGSIERHHLSDAALEENARMLESVLDDYGVKGEIVSVRPGPVVTMYELEPAPGLKASRVIGLSDDIARSMSALSARVSTVPGRSVIGIELPNENREKVVLREILAARDYGDGNHRLPLALGKNIGGDPVIANLAKMPHLLIAGTTGSGKSVAINTMILSLLYKLTPEECRLIMIDPKMLELSVYDGIPHLLSPVVTDPKKAVVALKWVVGEMEERYRRMSKMGVRNIEGFNGRVRDALKKGEMFSRTVQTGFDEETGEPIFETEEFAPETLPYIVVIVDEMADLMMVAGKEIEACIQRLAQMARASGIHLIMATQRPSVDVITGTIKANFPTRISFQVTSKVDSRTILGEMGAEQLLGMGDMLYMAGGAKITRVHGPFVSDEEVEEIVNHLKSFGAPEYVSGVQEGPDEEASSDIDMVLGLGGNTDGEDALYDQAVAIVIKDRKCSTSYIQRKLAIGYNKAARLVEQMEENGLVSPANHVGKREILVPEPQ
ncbi:DNA translocase FtsK [Alphaproteobacteria bacterium GH1-50]|uniref:DNA translocase FtsK n=1 Tax=Kangsaoukella pontilimi TaxID=2691042 RepID=A0A7C9MEV8_9RHOB|nr:DNA translocase FtsK [Kangsaoukella pontilimi]MXQ08512.1 DNA translocase FtsK [Kangsaoukella pontilimi]